MAKKPVPPVEVTCPCCRAKLTIDSQLAVVLSHEAPPKAAPNVDISEAARILQEQAQRREDKFRESWGAEKKKKNEVTPKVEKAPKKTKRQPGEKTHRDFDPQKPCGGVPPLPSA